MIDFKPLKSQHLAWQYLQDKETTEILFGGAAGGGKSRLICSWLIISCLQYPGTRYLLGRARLLNLKRTTVKTFFDLINEWNLGSQITYNQNDNIITFINGSEIILMDLYLYPQDAEFVRLGSLELTGAAIDEAAEISEKAFNILKTRIRYKLVEYNIHPKILIATNPSKNWCYNLFYKPDLDRTMPAHRKFISSLPTENKYLPSTYAEQLLNTDELTRQRLYYGNWDYEESAYDLFMHEAIVDSFYFTSTKDKEHRYITVDVAAGGDDKTVITFWQGWHCSFIEKYSKINTFQIIDRVKQLKSELTVPITNIIVDSIGVGVGVADGLVGCVRFQANEAPFNGEGFKNIKAQLFYKFSELMNSGQVSLMVEDKEKDAICQELEAHKRFNVDNDKKWEVTPKAAVRSAIGRSPDTADALMMRTYFEYRKKNFNYAFI